MLALLWLGIVMTDELPEGAIPQAGLVVGGIYSVHARNFSVAIWTGSAFRGPREKLGSHYLFDEFSFEDGPPNGTAYAVTRLGEFTCEELPPLHVLAANIHALLFALQASANRTWHLEEACRSNHLVVHWEGLGERFNPVWLEDVTEADAVRDAKYEWVLARHRAERAAGGEYWNTGRFKELSAEYDRLLAAGEL